MPKGGRRPIATMYSPSDYKVWLEEAAALLKAVDPTYFDGPVRLDATIYATKPRTTKLSHPKADIDNYVNGLMDAITKDGRFWHDDCQVTELSVAKQWAEPDVDRTGISVVISCPI